jgi:hypothetical protein
MTSDSFAGAFCFGTKASFGSANQRWTLGQTLNM